jgi:VIT1/CCC1 family predicted Fe2+/Mn2+ transporter
MMSGTSIERSRASEASFVTFAVGAAVPLMPLRLGASGRRAVLS